MEKIISAQPFYYGASKEAPNTVIVTVEMQDEIEEKLLSDVVLRVMERYPYFKKTVVVSGNEYVLEDNMEPVVVKSGSAPQMLGGKETNGHLLAFSCEGKKICLSFFHGLCDGAGLFPLIRSVLYYYCSEYYHTVLPARGVNQIGSPISDEEVEDPYPDHVDEGISAIGRYQGKRAFQLRDGGLVGTDCPTLFRIRIPENAFMAYTKAKDGSPATMISVFLYRAIHELHPDVELPIVCGMAMNIRPVLKKPKCHHSVVSQLFLEYKPRMAEMDVQTLATCSRGMVILQSQPENVWTSVRNNISFFANLKKLPDVPAKKEYMKQIVARSMQMDTFKVSYVGKASLGSAEKYVKAVDSCPNINGAGIMVEVNALNGWFHLSFMQEFEEDVYVKEFLKQLDMADIPFEAEKGVSFQTPSVHF